MEPEYINGAVQLEQFTKEDIWRHDNTPLRYRGQLMLAGYSKKEVLKKTDEYEKKYNEELRKRFQ